MFCHDDDDNASGLASDYLDRNSVRGCAAFEKDMVKSQEARTDDLIHSDSFAPNEKNNNAEDESNKISAKTDDIHRDDEDGDRNRTLKRNDYDEDENDDRKPAAAANNDDSSCDSAASGGSGKNGNDDNTYARIQETTVASESKYHNVVPSDDLIKERYYGSKHKMGIDSDDDNSEDDGPQYVFNSYNDDNEDILTVPLSTNYPNNANAKETADKYDEQDIPQPGVVHVPARAPGLRRISFQNRLSRFQQRRQQQSNSNSMATIPDKENDQIDIAHVVDVEKENEELNRKVGEKINSLPTVTAEEIDNFTNKKRRFCIVMIASGLVTACVVLVVLFTREARNNSSSVLSTKPEQTPSPTNTQRPTLETVKERGVLRCGVSPLLPGFIGINEITGEREGFEIDLCRSVAAAVIGSNYSIETMELTIEERFLGLANESIDLLIHAATHTMERDVYQADAKAGFSFTTPYLYDGLGFGGEPSFVECADNVQAYGNCSELTICVAKDTTHYKILQELFPVGSLYTLSDDKNVVKRLINGDCNVIAGEKTYISETVVRSKGYTGEYSIGKSILSKEPLAIVTREDDYEWSQTVNWVLQAQFLAEAMNITQDDAVEFSNISPFGQKYNDMFINAISAVGNYGERYERYLEKILPRQGLNMLYLGYNQLNDDRNNNGLIYSYPFGPIDNNGTGPTVGSRLSTITERGMLRCGITEVRDGFAIFDTDRQEWSGLDIDYCKAIAAAMFGGMADSSTIEYVNVTNQSTYHALMDYNVDLLFGVNIDIEANIEKRISFSQPYFYEGTFKSRSLATYNGKDDDIKFSDFVFWVVSSTFYAEEGNISSSTSNDMPEVRIFGSKYHRMFRDTILITGNYGEIYERNVQPIIPRSGRNNLNNPMIGPQINPYVGL